MENLATNVTVKSIIFESNDSEVLVKCIIEKGNLSYDGELIINQSQLNRLVCAISRKSKQVFQQENLFQSESIGENEKLYYADFKSAPKVQLHELQNIETIRQIRA